ASCQPARGMVAKPRRYCQNAKPNYSAIAMLPIVVGLAAALALCLAAVVVLVNRARRRPEPRVIEASAVGNLEARMEELARELQESVRRAEEETQRTRFLNQIGTTVDLDHVLEATLDAALALPRVDAALVRLDGGDASKPIASSRGFGHEDPD